jgi:AraC family transcriptional regulator
MTTPVFPNVIIASAKRPGGVTMQVRRERPGSLSVPPLENALLSVHIGPPTKVACVRGGKRFFGTALHGDVDIVPEMTPARWEIDGDADKSVLFSIPAPFLSAAVQEMTTQKQIVEVLNRFQARDPVLAALATAVARELEDGNPSGGLYLDGIALAAASRLIARHSSLSPAEPRQVGGLSGSRLKAVLTRIEESLESDLSLAGLAATARISPSHLNSSFRKAMGSSVHQYVLQRRVEKAKTLLAEGNSSIADVALAAGFAHQSHMARHMVRVLGTTPSEVKRLSCKHPAVRE